MSTKFFEPDVVILANCCPEDEEPQVDVIDQAIAKEGWHAHVAWKIEKYEGDFASQEEAIAAGAKLLEVIEGEGNMLVNNGAQLLEDALIGTAITAFSNANARIGVGDSATAASASQTDLQAATNKLRKAMDATFPSRASQTLTFKSTFASADANYAWNEWAIFNAASGATSMLNRKVESMGTKSAGQTWVHTATFTLS
jgi:hypothetical protein